MEPTVIDSSFSLIAWIGIGVVALLGAMLVTWLYGGFVDIGAASLERPRQRHGRNRFVPRRLAEELEAMNHLTDEDLDYELSTLQPKADMGFGVESTHLPVYEAREIAGIPMWRIRKLLSLSTPDLETRADVNRWQEVHDILSMRLHKVALALNARREALAIAQGDVHVPDYLKVAGDTELELPVVTGSLHA